MTADSKNEIQDFFTELKETETTYADYEKRFEPLAVFLTDYDHAKELEGLTQAEIAKRMGTTQSAVSRFEAMKNPPKYDMLRKASVAVGDKLFVTPLGSMSMTLPYDLHEKAYEIAEKKEVTVRELMKTYIREGLNRDSFKSLETWEFTESSTVIHFIPEAPYEMEGYKKCRDTDHLLAG